MATPPTPDFYTDSWQLPERVAFALVDALRTKHPTAFDALTTQPWTFLNRSPCCDHRWTGPVIDLGVDDQPVTLRAFYPVRAFPAMGDADVPMAYEAMRVLHRHAEQESIS